MTNLIVELGKYLLVILICLYTFLSFHVFRLEDERSQKSVYFNQNYLMFMIHLLGFLIIYLKTGDVKVWMFYTASCLLLLAIVLFYALFYKRSNRLLTNNMCMLLAISFVILTRLDYDASFRQFEIVALSSAVCAVIPIMIDKIKFFRKIPYMYGVVGIVLLLAVAALSIRTHGAKLSFTVAGITVQPSEFVKLIYVFFIASMFYKSKSRRQIMITSAMAALHVLILVLSRDLGMALIFFVVYLVMLLAGTKKIALTLGALVSGMAASVVAYKLFSHVRTRVLIWKDPFGNYNNGGYQVAQSLFAIGTGGWFGMGLYQGSPNLIPFVEKDFIFSAIVEEMGAFFGICIILICLSCFVMFVNISLQLDNEFYKLVALGLGTSYAIQIVLTIGGGIKMIPLTGVTLPLISLGGSSMLSTIAMFAIVQGMYILREDEVLEQAKEDEEREEREEEIRDYVRKQKKEKIERRGFSAARIERPRRRGDGPPRSER